MNLKEGRIGRQEALALIAIAGCCSGIFTAKGWELYANGNSAYVAVLISAGFALLIFTTLTFAMKVTGAKDLWQLLKKGWGRVLSRVVAVLYAALLIAMAANIFGGFTLTMSRFVFPRAEEWKTLLYMLAGASVVACLGLEGLSRTARLLVWVLLFSLLGALALAGGNYQISRLAPVMGDGVISLLEKGIRGISWFLPSLLALLVVTKGVHGIKFANSTGVWAGITAGLLCALTQLALGMTYSYSDLALMHSPLYRLTTIFNAGGYIPRLDILLMFGWVLSGMLAAGFYIYAGALLYAKAFLQEDVRPALFVFAAIAGCCALLLNMQVEAFDNLIAFIEKYAFIFICAPVLLAALIAPLRWRYRHVRGED